MASITKRPDGRWRARWREHPGAPERSRHFARKVDAERFLDHVRGQLASGTYVDPAQARRIRLGEFAEQWLESQPWRQSSRDRSESMYRRHIAPAFADRPIGTLRPSELQSWATGLDLAPSTVEGVVQLLRAVLSAAVEDRILATNPAIRIRLRSGDGNHPVPLTVAEVKRLAAAAPPELEAAVVVGAATGLRQGELFGLTGDRVGWLKRELVIDRQLVTPARGEAHLGPCKTSRSVRTVPVADHALEALSRHVERHGLSPDGYVFHRHGRPWPRNRASAAFTNMKAAASVDATGWHALRHHAASVLIAQGLGVTAVASVLGHSPAECLKTYAAWWPAEHEQIRAAVARAWADPPADLLRTDQRHR